LIIPLFGVREKVADRQVSHSAGAAAVGIV
jgi:hypothetical protein